MTGEAGRTVSNSRPPIDLDRTIARLLTAGTYLSIALLAIGVVQMVAGGIGPLTGGPRFDPDRLGADLTGLRPSGFLWLGLVAVVATPASRVIAALIGFIRSGERPMIVVAASILAVIAIAVGLARGLEG